MQTKEYRTIDKTAWGEGPWQGEYDKKQWVDPETGLPCLVKRHPNGGHLCGYVGVSPGHPLYEKGYDEAEVSAHGGLTYSDFCQNLDNEAEGICHVVELGDEEKVWWLGFDCAHGGDARPGADAIYLEATGKKSALAHGEPYVLGLNTYKTTDYVEAECLDLAKQLKEIA